jgi:hypothetical protein
MPYAMKPLACDPARIRGMSERLIVSHYENNYGGAVKRLNSIEEKLAELDYANASGFLVNGLKREQLIAMNSMILHELFFDGLGEQGEPDSNLQAILARDFGSYDRWRSEFVAMGKRWAAARAGFCCPGQHAIASLLINGRPTTVIRSQADRPYSLSICTSIPTISTLGRRRAATWIRSWR